MRDPLEWLNHTGKDGAKAMAWAREQTDRSISRLRRSGRFADYQATAKFLSQRIGADVPGPTELMYHGGWVYRVIQDSDHPRGIWRRSKLDAYLRGEPSWEVLFDVDALAAADNRPWRFYTATFLDDRCMVYLIENNSPTRAVIREFDLESRTFVDNGFALSDFTLGENVEWKDRNTLIVATDFGPGSVSEFGAPIQVKAWERGRPLSEAKELFHGNANTAVVYLRSVRTDTGRREILMRESMKAHKYGATWRLDVEKDRFERMPLPPKSEPVGILRSQWIIRFSADQEWQGRVWKSGTLASIHDADVMRPNAPMRIVAEPEAGEQVLLLGVTKSGILVSSMVDVQGRIARIVPRDNDWVRVPVPIPTGATAYVGLTDPTLNKGLITYETFVEPRSLVSVNVESGKTSMVARDPRAFDGSQYIIERLKAKSRDGTEVPYFLVRSKSLKFDGHAPTLIYGYGASGAIKYPTYDPFLGKMWLERGGVYALANIRGGGEFGERWHVRKTERRHTYEDFISVAEHLIDRNVTSPRHLGIRGHSHGGLLMGVVLNQRPDLFNAVVMENPVLDLLAPARPGDDRPWVGKVAAQKEHGSLDVPEERAFILGTSPYQNLAKRKKYPPPFIVTSASDVDVPAGMARRYAAKLGSLGSDFYYYETEDTGHSSWVTPEQHALYETLLYTYLAERLM